MRRALILKIFGNSFSVCMWTFLNLAKRRSINVVKRSSTTLVRNNLEKEFSHCITMGVINTYDFVNITPGEIYSIWYLVFINTHITKLYVRMKDRYTLSIFHQPSLYADTNNLTHYKYEHEFNIFYFLFFWDKWDYILLGQEDKKIGKSWEHRQGGQHHWPPPLSIYSQQPMNRIQQNTQRYRN